MSLEKKEVEPVEPFLKNIYQSNTYRKDLSWPYFDDEPRVQEKQQVKHQQSCISIFVACLTIRSDNWGLNSQSQLKSWTKQKSQSSYPKII